MLLHALPALPQHGRIHIKALLLPLVNEFRWFHAKVLDFPTGEPETHPVAQVESRTAEEWWRRYDGIQIFHVTGPPGRGVLVDRPTGDEAPRQW